MQTVKSFIEGFKDFQHVTVSVSDVNKSLAFYRDLLGFPVLGRLYYKQQGRPDHRFPGYRQQCHPGSLQLRRAHQAH